MPDIANMDSNKTQTVVTFASATFVHQSHAKCSANMDGKKMTMVVKYVNAMVSFYNIIIFHEILKI